MNALILAAGRGERLRPLTDDTPKPLLSVGGQTLIDRHLGALASAGCTDIVINISWLGEMIRRQVGDGRRWGVRVHYSDEGARALETGGGIVRALGLLGERPFLVVNGDVVTDYPFARLNLAPADLSHLVLIDNPPHHERGDFALAGHRVRADGEPRLTFSGIGIYHPRLFANQADGHAPLAPVLRAAMEQDRVSGEHYRGLWLDIGTPDRLARARRVINGH